MSKRFDGRYVFVGGLHRSGTSLLTRLIAQHPNVAAIEASPAPENEGCYLQGAIPHTARHGRPGHFATDPEQHLVEGCRFDSRDTALRIEDDWDRWFPPGGAWRVEKSPVNLCRTRLYQQLFPMSQFILILRHPSIVAAAHAKWVDAPHEDLIGYALAGYERAVSDTAYLHAAMIIRYEDMVRSPASLFAAIDTFLGLEVHERAFDLRDGNAEYPGIPPVTDDVERRMKQFGYHGAAEVGAFTPIVHHPLREIREATGSCFAKGSNPW